MVVGILHMVGMGSVDVVDNVDMEVSSLSDSTLFFSTNNRKDDVPT